MARTLRASPHSSEWSQSQALDFNRSSDAEASADSRCVRARARQAAPRDHRGVPYCVVKTETGAVRAFVAACSHEDRAIVPFRCKRGQIVCPHHGARFDATTGEVADARGNDVPERLKPVDVVIELLGKKERKRVAKLEGDC